jgi:hypothetical protein
MESKQINTTPVEVITTTTPTATVISANPEERIKTFKGQIEYYLSDENLQKDKFFHDKISTDAEGYLNVEHILACNKIKAVNATKDEIINAAKLSSDLEVSGDKVRRAGNKPLPELKFLAKKTQRPEREEKEEKEDANADESFDPVILEITSDKEPETFKWKNIQDKFRELNKNLRVAYLRFSRLSGHIGVFNNQPELTFTTEFEIEGVKFTVKKCEGDELISFWKDHGSHFEMCIGRNQKFDKKGGRKERTRKDTSYLKSAVTLGDESFTDVTKIKSRARKILTSTKDGEKINSPDHDFLTDLLKNHRNFENKVKDIQFFTTGRPSEHNYSRCFFIVKNDSTQEDFSIHKCIERITNENKKRK